MGFLVVTLLVSATVGGLVLRRSWQQQHRDRLRDQSRLKVIEAQMAGLRAALRIQAAEHVARQRIHTTHNEVFRNSTVHEEPDEWRR